MIMWEEKIINTLNKILTNYWPVFLLYLYGYNEIDINICDGL